MLPLGALLIAGVGLHVEEARDVPLEAAVELARSLAVEIERRTGTSCRVDDVDWSSCRESRCIEEARARTQAGDMIMIRLIRGVTRTRIIAARFAPGQLEPSHESAIEFEDRADELMPGLARALFPEGTLAVAVPPPPAPEESGLRPMQIAAWVLAGTAVGLAGSGIGLGVSSIDARRAVESRPLMPEEVEALSDRAQAHAWAGNVLIWAALIAGASAVTLALVE